MGLKHIARYTYAKKQHETTLKYFLHFVEKLLQNGCICLDTCRPYLYNSSGFQAENGLFFDMAL
jgi:hypothetical protein